MIKNIFEVLKEPSQEQKVIEFDHYLAQDGAWRDSGDASNTSDNCILIKMTQKYDYYLLFDNSTTNLANLANTDIKRVRR